MDPENVAVTNDQKWRRAAEEAGKSGAAEAEEIRAAYAETKRPVILEGTVTGFTRSCPRCGGLIYGDSMLLQVGEGEEELHLTVPTSIRDAIRLGARVRLTVTAWNDPRQGLRYERPRRAEILSATDEDFQLVTKFRAQRQAEHRAAYEAEHPGTDEGRADREEGVSDAPF
jgi:hypothetical protein